MSAMTDTGSLARAAGYSGASRAALRGGRPAWFVVAFDTVAIVLALGLLHTVHGMIFSPQESETSSVTAVEDVPIDRAAAAARANFARIPPPSVLARLAQRNRTATPEGTIVTAALVAGPDAAILFAEPTGIEERFDNQPPTPFAGGFSSGEPIGNASSQGNPGAVAGGGGPPGSGGGSTGGSGGGDPPLEEPVDETPTLLSYVPLPEPIARAVEPIASQPIVHDVVRVVEAVTGPALDLSLSESSGSGGGSTQTVQVVSPGSPGATSGTPSVTQSVTTVTTSTAASLGATVGSTVDSVTRILR